MGDVVSLVEKAETIEVEPKKLPLKCKRAVTNDMLKQLQQVSKWVGGGIDAPVLERKSRWP